MKGMNGRLLYVNLSNNSLKEYKLGDEILREYIGGRALGVKLLWDMLPKNTDPLSPENILIFAGGPFGGTAIPTNGRFALVTKSPLTNGIFYSNTGGFFGPYLKSCGYDGIIVTGKSEKPVYLSIDGEGNGEIRDASDIWGKDTEESVAEIRKKEGKDIRTLVIGPAGENTVRISAIMNEGARAFGRGGVGAVMGSKNLKAIVTQKGKIKTEVNDPDYLKTLIVTAHDRIKLVPITRSALPNFGTPALVNIINELGMFPVKNFREGYDPRAVEISGEAIRKKIFRKREGCFACPIRCGRYTEAGGMPGKGPEYESVWALGANLGIFDLIKVARANYLCNRLGLDTISTGGSLACAMELAEKGLIKNDRLYFGNADELEEFVKKIAAREGIFRDIGEGSYRLAVKYGDPDTAMQVKGLELPAYDPRGAVGHALGYATSNRGGCHLTGYLAAMEIFAAPKKINRFTTGGKADLLVLKQNQSAVEDSLVVCKFAGWALDFEFYSRMTTAITGTEYTVTDLLRIGERSYNMERLFNIREGDENTKRDILPRRFLEEPLEKGFSKGHTVPLSNMLKEYYYVRGWDENGQPTRKKLEELGLLDILDKM